MRRRLRDAELIPNRGAARVAKSREGAAAPAGVGNNLGEACLLQGRVGHAWMRLIFRDRPARRPTAGWGNSIMEKGR
ncbi:protein of unknown function [Streptomyces murinus]